MSIRMGVVGTGIAFWDLHLPVLKELSVIKITHIVASSPESSQRAAAKLNIEGIGAKATTLESLLKEDVDAVLVAVPIDLTSQVVTQVLQAKKHVFAEKPLATTSKEGRALIKLAKDADRILFVGENWRFQPDFKKVNKFVKQGLIGKPKVYFLNDLHFTASDGKYAATKWRTNGDYPGGYNLDGGSHIVAGLRQMVGLAVNEVHSLTTKVQPYLSKEADTALINIKFANGVVGHLAMGYGVFDNESRHPKIYGAKGTVALMPDGIYLINSDGEEKLAERDTTTGFGEEWNSFLKILDSKDRIASDQLAEESLKDLEVIEAALQSASTGKVITSLNI